MGALKLLLDTHTFYWWHIDDAALSSKAQAAIANSQNEKHVSAITGWELVTRFRSGKEPRFGGIAADVAEAIAAWGFTALAITVRHSEVAARLPPHHKNPMDRFLIA